MDAFERTFHLLVYDNSFVLKPQGQWSNANLKWRVVTQGLSLAWFWVLSYVLCHISCYFHIIIDNKFTSRIIQCDVCCDNSPARRALRIDGLVQNCSNPGMLAVELEQSCTKPSNSRSTHSLCISDITWKWFWSNDSKCRMKFTWWYFLCFECFMVMGPHCANDAIAKTA